MTQENTIDWDAILHRLQSATPKIANPNKPISPRGVKLYDRKVQIEVCFNKFLIECASYQEARPFMKTHGYTDGTTSLEPPQVIKHGYTFDKSGDTTEDMLIEMDYIPNGDSTLLASMLEAVLLKNVDDIESVDLRMGIFKFTLLLRFTNGKLTT